MTVIQSVEMGISFKFIILGIRCSAAGVIESGWMCIWTGASSVCKETCGDGIAGTFACDDGNTLSGDGCSSVCTIEAGFTCPAAKFGACTE